MLHSCGSLTSWVAWQDGRGLQPWALGRSGPDSYVLFEELVGGLLRIESDVL